MSKPPVMARAVERGLAPLRGRRASHLLPRARLGGPMPWVIAIMVALTVLATGGVLALTNLVDRARADLAGGVTVQIVEADPVLRAAQAERTMAVLRDLPGVGDQRLVPQAELEALIEPWLGGGVRSEVVPLPALIDVRLEGEVHDEALDSLRSALAEVAPDARVDAQSDWLGPVFDAIAALRWLALGLIALLAFTSAAAVWLAARNALNANRSTIEVVHLLGGTDGQIARIFQRSVLIDAALGGLVGLILGAVALTILGAQFAALDAGLVQGGGLDAIDWLLMALVPFAAVAIALLTARMTVLASLRKMS
ncbi:cell division protein [Qipengyuania sp. DY56-A-20]|uniref:Cell division protein n=1 Tax=Qipengyuania benthica TaxID=3067651 RepID=A0ABT9H4V5_9SPHN|nr:cell division protein [Qipengyuania sp. DY56-A-20]MDP4538354.1 cell division protein [Qipengyuania sp. DY56-A-20]